MKGYGVIILTVVLAVTSARNVRQASSNFVGDGTSQLTVAILECEKNNEENFVFSPLGYSTILAMMGEGARGETRNQLMKGLKLPEDTSALRTTYKSILSNMQEHGVPNQPEFKNWFYVYENYTVEESYKAVLLENYLTKVREVVKDYYYLSREEDKTTEKNKSSEEMDKSSEESKPDKDKMSSEETSGETSQEMTDATMMEMKKKLVEKEKEIMEREKKVTEKEKEIMEKEKKIEEKEKLLFEKEKKFSQKDQAEKHTLKETITRSLQIEIQTENEMLSALSANRLSSMDSDEDPKEPTSRMLVFNALYFAGNWTTPFTLFPEKKEFSCFGAEPKLVEMLHGEGEYQYGSIPELGASAVEIPYQGERYSLLLVVPDEGNLTEVSSKLLEFSFTNIDKYLTKRQVEICLPRFKFYSITKPKNALKKMGITDIFEPNADLSGITGKQGLFLDDLVQLVTLEVDDNSAGINYLTSTSGSDFRSAAVIFKANKPFLFFLRDRVENLLVVAGKVYSPSFPKGV